MREVRHEEKHRKVDLLHLRGLGLEAQAFSDFFKDGGKGVSITLPLKEAALNYADEISERARFASACNVIYEKDEKLFADCTDGFGLIKDLEENLKVSLKDKKILILGAGGAARGIIPSIIEKKPAKLKVANRTESKALLLREDLEAKVNLKEKNTIFEAVDLSDDYLLDDSYDPVSYTHLTLPTSDLV